VNLRVRLSLFTDYALRALMVLAREPDRPHTAEAIAERFGISHEHVVKVMRELVRARWAKARRGRGGGSTLIVDADRITVAQVIRRFEERLDPLECLQRPGLCGLQEHGCRLQAALGEAMDLFLQRLDGLTIADIAVSLPVGVSLIPVKPLPGSAPISDPPLTS
jgi:Rrf2 family nitric oxide-sensitive transcriptional repressor